MDSNLNCPRDSIFRDLGEFQVFCPTPELGLRIGVCIEQPREALLESIRMHTGLCSLQVFSTTHLTGLECRVSSNPAAHLALAFQRGEIDGLVRGVNDDFTFQSTMREVFGCPPFLRLAILRDTHGRSFAMGPVSAAEASTLEERKDYAWRCCTFLEKFGIVPRAAVMAGCRSGSRTKNRTNQDSWEDAEAVTAYLKGKGISAANYEIELDLAVQEANIVFPVNGLVGNQIYRSLVFLGAGAVVAVPAFTRMYDPLLVCYEDNSRNENEYGQHIRAAMALAVARKKAIGSANI